MMVRFVLGGLALGVLVMLARSPGNPGLIFDTAWFKQLELRQPAVPGNRVSQSHSSQSAIEQAIHTQINQYRAKQGLPPLTLDSRVSEQARLHSQNMANGRVIFGHGGFDQRAKAIAQVIPYRGFAENVAYNQGYRDPATQAVQGWIKSSGHRTNIEGSYNLTGIGVVKNSRGEYYFTQLFVRRR